MAPQRPLEPTTQLAHRAHLVLVHLLVPLHDELAWLVLERAARQVVAQHVLERLVVDVERERALLELGLGSGVGLGLGSGLG